MSFQCPEGLRCICAQKALGHGTAAAFSGDFKHLALCLAYAGICAGSSATAFLDPTGAMSVPAVSACFAMTKGLTAYESASGNNLG